MLPELTAYWPYAAVAAGVLWFGFGQRDRLTAVLGRLRGLWSTPNPTPPPDEFPFGDRMEAFRRLRAWLSAAGRIKAVDALDSVLLELAKEDGT